MLMAQLLKAVSAQRRHQVLVHVLAVLVQRRWLEPVTLIVQPLRQVLRNGLPLCDLESRQTAGELPRCPDP